MNVKMLKMRKPSFIKGMARVLDLGSTIKIYDYEYLGEPEKIDFEVMNSDWIRIGKDIKAGIIKYQRDIHGKSKRKSYN
ncbi:MAG: hypothetical protein K6U80_03255 [Firmicutes bacterium]|nr:hypothetical protein [Bacillota bacterium]